MFRNAIVRTAAKRLVHVQQTRSLASSTLYIGNLPLGTDEAKLAPVVEKFGPIFEYHFPAPRPDDTFTSVFVKLYSGDLPATIEELAALPTPPPEEISEVTKRGSAAIQAIAGSELDGHSLTANFARKNMPDAIQFHARMTVRKATDPQFGTRARSNGDGRRNKEGSDYAIGYKDGFKAGMMQATRNQGN